MNLGIWAEIDANFTQKLFVTAQIPAQTRRLRCPHWLVEKGLCHFVPRSATHIFARFHLAGVKFVVRVGTVGTGAY